MKNKAIFIFAGAIIVTIIAVTAGVSVYRANKIKSVKEALANDINLSGSMSAAILNDYSFTWQTSINGGYVLNRYNASVYRTEGGEDVFQNDINERILLFRNIKAIDKIDSLKRNIQKDLDFLDKKDEEYDAFIKAFDYTSKMINLVNDPMGSLFTFNQSINSIMTDFYSAMDKISIKHSLPNRVTMTDSTKVILNNMLSSFQKSLIKQAGLDEELLKKQGFEKLDCGVFYKVIQKGTSSAKCNINSKVSIAYSFSLKDGKIIDKSNGFIDSKIEYFIAGFRDAILEMSPGDTWDIIIPFYLGYGDKTITNIPPYSNLYFTVSLGKIW